MAIVRGTALRYEAVIGFYFHSVPNVVMHSMCQSTRISLCGLWIIRSEVGERIRNPKVVEGTNHLLGPCSTLPLFDLWAQHPASLSLASTQCCAHAPVKSVRGQRFVYDSLPVPRPPFPFWWHYCCDPQLMHQSRLPCASCGAGSSSASTVRVRGPYPVACLWVATTDKPFGRQMCVKPQGSRTPLVG